MNGSDPVLRSRLLALLLVLAVLLSGGVALPLTGASPAKLFDAEGLKNAGDILSGLARPDFSAEFLARVLELSLESLLIGVLGTVMGVIGGILLTINLEYILAAIEAVFNVTLLPSDVYYITGLPYELDAGEVVLIAAVALTMSFLATLYPAWRAARTQPAEALRYE